MASFGRGDATPPKPSLPSSDGTFAMMESRAAALRPPTAGLPLEELGASMAHKASKKLKEVARDCFAQQLLEPMTSKDEAQNCGIP